MLVLSRRVDQEIVFPNTGISLKLLQIRGQVVKIGVEAPPEIRVLRKEVCTDEDLQIMSEGSLSQLSRHEIRNRLNAINLATHLFQKQTEAGLHAAAQVTFHRLTTEFASLDSIIGEARPSRPSTKSKGTGRKLLVVDDDKSEREMLIAILQLHGFEVLGAADGNEALDCLFQNSDLDAVLLDIRMPKCDGMEALHRIREDEKLCRLSVYAMTGMSEHESDIQTRVNGFDGWFAKPLDPDRLIASMTAKFSRPSLSASV